MQQHASPVRCSCSSISCHVQSAEHLSQVFATSSSSKRLLDQLSLLTAVKSRDRKLCRLLLGNTYLATNYPFINLVKQDAFNVLG